MNALTPSQAQALVGLLPAGTGPIVSLHPATINALVASRLIRCNTLTNHVELTHDGIIVAKTLVATDDQRLAS